MARPVRAAPAKPVQWPCALYIRLSREDGDKEESDSVVNQRALLTAFVQAAPELPVYDTYVDDGFTGANFDRPAFQRLMADITAGRVRCVVVKDLSRFGRNYIEAGRYLEQVFPAMGVRFIAVNDRIDSHTDPDSVNGLLLPFRNLINDEYCRDISLKVRSALDAKRRQGQFIGSFAPYGYRKDPADRGRLVPDPDTAPVVQGIFQSFLNGQSILSIARALTAERQPTPSARRTGGSACLWNDSSVRRILTGCVYCGHTAQGKRRAVSHRVKKSLCVPPSDWTVVYNTHEPIVSQEDFDRCAALLARNTRVSPVQGTMGLFAGLLFCADCGSPMHKKTIRQPYGDYVYYICSGFKKRRVCTKHTIRADLLERAVSETVSRHIELCLSRDELLAACRSADVPPELTALKKRLDALRAEREETDRLRLDLYPDWKRGVISQADYLALKARFDDRLADLSRAEEAARARLDSFSPERGRALLAHFIRYHRFKALTRSMTTELIERIDVSEGGKIDILFRYRDEFSLSEP